MQTINEDKNKRNKHLTQSHTGDIASFMTTKQVRVEADLYWKMRAAAANEKKTLTQWLHELVDFRLIQKTKNPMTTANQRNYRQFHSHIFRKSLEKKVAHHLAKGRTAADMVGWLELPMSVISTGDRQTANIETRMTTAKLLGCRVLLCPMPDETRSNGGIVVPKNRRKAETHFIVHATGPGEWVNSRRKPPIFVKPEVKPGDQVISDHWFNPPATPPPGTNPTTLTRKKTRTAASAWIVGQSWRSWNICLQLPHPKGMRIVTDLIMDVATNN